MAENKATFQIKSNKLKCCKSKIIKPIQGKSFDIISVLIIFSTQLHPLKKLMH